MRKLLALLGGVAASLASILSGPVVSPASQLGSNMDKPTVSTSEAAKGGPARVAKARSQVKFLRGEGFMRVRKPARPKSKTGWSVAEGKRRARRSGNRLRHKAHLRRR